MWCNCWNWTIPSNLRQTDYIKAKCWNIISVSLFLCVCLSLFYFEFVQDKMKYYDAIVSVEMSCMLLKYTKIHLITLTAHTNHVNIYNLSPSLRTTVFLVKEDCFYFIADTSPSVYHKFTARTNPLASAVFYSVSLFVTRKTRHLLKDWN